MKSFYISACIAGFLAFGTASRAASLQLTPSTPSVAVGQTVNLDVRISGLGDGVAPSVGVFDLDIAFDPALMSFSGASFGTGLDVLGLGSIQDAKTTSPGIVNLFELSLDSVDDLNQLQPADFLLGRLSFTALAGGDSTFNLSVNAIGDAVGESLSVAPVLPVHVQISGVPEPETHVLLLGGLGLLYTIARRNRQAVAA